MGVKSYCSEVVGRKDWSPGSEEGVERVFTDRPYTTMVLPRDKLCGALYSKITSQYDSSSVLFNFGTEVDINSFGDDLDSKVSLTITKCGDGSKEDVCDATSPGVSVSCNFVIAADGSSRTLATRMAEVSATKVVAYEDDNVRIYKTIPLKLPKEWRWDLNYSARTADGRFNLDALPASKDGDYCAVMLLKEADGLAKEGADAKVMREDFNRVRI